jgi:hypothetical protein
MPRRGSRSQLIHLLARSRAHAIREVYGDRVHPAELYEDFAPYGRGDLEEWARGIEPARRGRPKRGSRYATLIAKVDEVLRSGLRKTERGACLYVARNARVSVDMLRKAYRAKRPN